MKNTVGFVLVAVIVMSCNSATTTNEESVKTGLPVVGTWELFSATLVEKGDSVITDFTRGQKMIKIINPTHFAFLRHDLNKGKDSAIYSSGGGSYTLAGDQYTEHLEYCSDRGWEGHNFTFTLSISNDTLIQTGIEKIDSLGIDRLNIEKYILAKN